MSVMKNDLSFDASSSLVSSWLRTRVHETEACLANAHTAFQRILDNIVSGHLDAASKLLSNHASCVNEKASAADQLVQCNYKILNMTVVLNSLFANQDYLRILRNQIPNMPEPSPPHNNENHLPLNASYIQLETYSSDNAVDDMQTPQLENESQPNSGIPKSYPSQFNDVDRSTTPESNGEVGNEIKRPQQNINMKRLMEYESSDSECMSAASTSADHVQEASCMNTTAVNECDVSYRSDKSLCSTEKVKNVADTDSSSVYVGTAAASDHLREFFGVVSEVVTPSRFYVQRTSDLETLEVVQNDLNACFKYTEQVGDKLRFADAPKPGDMCVAQYTADNNWYRGRVLELDKADTVVVEYIDYGNTDDILWSRAFKMPESFVGIPSLSIGCTLGGVRPVGDKKHWDANAAKWFDEMIFDRTVTVVPIFKKSGAISVQLFMDSAETNTASICVSDFMVEAGFAEYDVHEECLSTSVFQSDRNVQCKSQVQSAPGTVSDRQRDTGAVHSYVASGADDIENVSRKALLHSPKTVRSQSNNDSKQKSDIGTATTKNMDDLRGWNPLAEDFKSLSNNYGINNENACTMIEGYDPESVNVCRYHRAGNCWRGDHCPNVHQDPTGNGEFKAQVQTFSGSSIARLSLSVGSVCVVRVTKVDEARNFYVHVVKRIEHDTKITPQCDLMGQRLSQEMREMSDDMERYCKSGSRRMDNLLRCALGELFIVYVAKFKCHCRAMIISGENFNTLRVHLVDLGVDVEVGKTNLNRMCPAFMHLPEQSVHCALSQGSSELYKRMEGMARDPESPNLLMKVLDTCEVTDGPLRVMLYSP